MNSRNSRHKQLYRFHEEASLSIINPLSMYLPIWMLSRIGSVLEEAVLGLWRGFRIVTVEPYCVIVARGDAIVDIIHIYPIIGKRSILMAAAFKGPIFRAFGGVEILVLKEVAEAVFG